MIISSNWMALKANGLTAKKSIVKRFPPDDSKHKDPRRKSENQKYVALDCEMVEGKSIEHMLARVSIVDFEGRVVYDAYVKPREEVRDYRTSITGITMETLRRRGEPFQVVRSRVAGILKDKIVVGHALHHDFETLEIPRPDDQQIRDTCLNSALKPPNRKQTPSLRLLSEYWLDRKVQDGSHSSVEDARMAMLLFKKFKDQWEASLE
jgi:RNA exonuclease 4